MSTTIEQWREYLVDLDAAIASGALSVSHNGKTVTYGSMADLQQRRAFVIAKIGGTAARRRRFRQFRFVDGRR